MPEDEILTLEPVEEETREPRLTPERARIAFLSLAGVAIVALAVAVLAIALAPDAAVTILVISLILLAVVVVAEIGLLFAARPRNG